MGRSSTGEALVEIYAKEKDPDIRKGVINALFVQSNADCAGRHRAEGRRIRRSRRRWSRSCR